MRKGRCHYCKNKGLIVHADTVDHIVPRCQLIPLAAQPHWFRDLNRVPACFDCNNKKGNSRSDCCCETCLWAWKVAKVFFLKEVFNLKRKEAVEDELRTLRS